MSNVVATTKYVRKPMFVDAVQVTAENFQQLADWCQGTIRSNETHMPVSWGTGENVDPSAMHIYVRVHQPKSPKQTEARVGDWLLYTERGYKVYTDKAFRNSFLEASDSVVRNPDQFTLEDVKATFPGSEEITPEHSGEDVSAGTESTQSDAGSSAVEERNPIEMTERERIDQIKAESTPQGD